MKGLEYLMWRPLMRKKISFYIAQYPVRWAAQSALQFLNEEDFRLE